MKKNRFITLDTPEARIIGHSDTVYPRPQLRRDSFFSLDGIWNFSARPSGMGPNFDKRIRVPFPAPSFAVIVALSSLTAFAAGGCCCTSALRIK